MNVIALSETDPGAKPAQTMGTLGNAMAIGTAAIRNMVGKELAAVPEVDLEAYLATVIVTELENRGGNR